MPPDSQGPGSPADWLRHAASDLELARITRRIVPPLEVQDAASLTDYAVGSRYPGDLEPVTEEEYREAVRLAETVVRWAESLVGTSDAP
jgi:HEPN domain-containing protein